jgi:hypothetical protein
MTVLLGGPGKRCVVLMNQSSRDYTLLDVRPSPGPGRGAVSCQSSRDKRRKRSLPGSTVRREGRAISPVEAELPTYLYDLIKADTEIPDGLTGLGPSGRMSTIVYGRVAAIVSDVPTDRPLGLRGDLVAH